MPLEGDNSLALMLRYLKMNTINKLMPENNWNLCLCTCLLVKKEMLKRHWICFKLENICYWKPCTGTIFPYSKLLSKHQKRGRVSCNASLSWMLYWIAVIFVSMENLLFYFGFCLTQKQKRTWSRSPSFSVRWNKNKWIPECTEYIWNRNNQRTH